MENEINKKNLSAQILLYVVASAVSYFISYFLKSEFDLGTPLVVILFEISTAVIFTVGFWFLVYRVKRRGKKFSIILLSILLPCFLSYSIMMFMYVNRVVIQAEKNGILTTYIVGEIDRDGKKVTDATEILLLYGWKPHIAFSDLKDVKIKLLIYSIVFISFVISVLSIMIELSGKQMIGYKLLQEEKG